MLVSVAILVVACMVLAAVLARIVFGTPRDLTVETKFERAWLALLDKIKPVKG